MFSNLFEGPHLLFIGVLALLIFGGKKLPELGKGLGEGFKGFKDGLKGAADDAPNDAHVVTPVEPKEPITKS